jgi:DNA-binding response OmpR family regulator
MSNSFTILIVDDEQELLEMYQDFLELEGFTVFSALSAILGNEILKANPQIQVIISDSHMPGMSGLEFLKLVSMLPSKPLFYLATGDIDQSKESIVQLGGTGLIAKPFDINEVITRIIKDLNGTV